MFDRNRIIKLMDNRGWTKYRLAKESEVSQSTIHDIVSGKKTSPNINTISKIAKALDVSIDAFSDESIEEAEEDYIDKLNDKEIIELYEAVQKNEILKKLITKTKDYDPNKMRKVLKMIDVMDED